MSGTESEFWEMRPSTNAFESSMLSCFWMLRRECDKESSLRSCDIIESIENVCVESDIGVSIIQAIDDHYHTLVVEEMKRKNRK